MIWLVETLESQKHHFSYVSYGPGLALYPGPGMRLIQGRIFVLCYMVIPISAEVDS